MFIYVMCNTVTLTDISSEFITALIVQFQIFIDA